jgi:hypothetical protein
MPKQLVLAGARVPARSRNPLRAAVRPRARQRNNQQQVARVPRGPRLNPLVVAQLDRIINPRTHFGETQPRARSEIGVLSTMTKTISSVTTGNVYKAIAMCSALNGGFIQASSAAATTDFADSNLVTGSSSYATTQMDRWCRAAGSLSVSLGMSALDAAGFVTYGSIPGNYTAGTTYFNGLDPGDLINAPGATTIPLWDFINNPPSGFMRKVSPVADAFAEAGLTIVNADQVSCPFVLFNLPSASVASFSALVLSYNTYDFYPDITDTGIPSVSPLMSVEAAAAYDVASNIASRIVNGFTTMFVPSQDVGSVGAHVYRTLGAAVDAYSARQDAFRAGLRRTGNPMRLIAGTQ